MNQQKQPVNEIARIVVDLSDLIQAHTDLMRHPFGSECRIFIAGDRQESGAIAWTMIGGIEWEYHLVDLLCRERAVDAEFGQLLADGRHLTAEKYLALWRVAGAKRIPLLQLVQFGLTPVFETILPTSLCKGKRAKESDAWYASPALVSSDDDKTVWSIRLDNAEAFKLASELRDVYWPTEMQGRGYGRTTRLDGLPQLEPTKQTFDLFKAAQ